MLPYRLNELEGTQLVPLPTGQKKQPPKGWTGSSATKQDIEEFFATHDYEKFSNFGIAFTDETYAGFDFDLHRNNQTLEEVTEGKSLPWTLGVSRRWEPEVEGFTLFYRVPHILADVSPVDIIRKGHRYSVISGDVEDKEYFLYWTNGVEFNRLNADTFADAWETLPEAPQWLTERHGRQKATRARRAPQKLAEGRTEALEGVVEATAGTASHCHRLAAVAAAGVRSVTSARAEGNSINQTTMLAQWALTAYVNHSGYATALRALHMAYQVACLDSGDHEYSQYEWDTALDGAYRKRGVTAVNPARRCSCSQAKEPQTPAEGEGTLADYYPLIMSEVAKAGFNESEREDVAQDVAVKIIKANPHTLTASYVRAAVRSVVVDEYRRREALQRLRVSVAAAQVVGEQTRVSDHAETLNRIVIQNLAAHLSPRERVAVQGHLNGEKLDAALRKRLSVAKKKMRLLATT